MDGWNRVELLALAWGNTMGSENAYNAATLDAELRSAGLEILGCSSTGRIDWKKPPSAADKKKAESVLKTHDPNALAPRETKLKALLEKRRQGKILTAQDIQDAIDLLLRT